MDIDRSLDDIMASKRKDKPARAGADRNKPRVSRDRREAVPYARPPPRSADEKWVHDAYDGPVKDKRDTRGERRPRGDRDDEFVGASPCILINGLHYEVTADDLKTIFSQAGTIVQGPTIRYDRSGRSTGVADVEYASAQQAKVAINKFDGALTKGQTISIKLIAPRRPRNDGPRKNQGQSGASLLARIGGERGGERGERNDRSRDRPARSDRERAPRGGARANGGGRRGAGEGSSSGGRVRRGPANQDALDKELDGFMKTDNADVDM